MSFLITLGLTHLKYKIKCNRRCGQICILDSWRFHAIGFSFNCVSPKYISLTQKIGHVRELLINAEKTSTTISFDGNADGFLYSWLSVTRGHDPKIRKMKRKLFTGIIVCTPSVRKIQFSSVRVLKLNTPCNRLFVSVRTKQKNSLS